MNNPDSPDKLWLKQAQDDLVWTKANITEKIWYGACFTAQQASEKALKSYLISNGKIHKKIHDLQALLNECILIDNSFETIKDECRTLTGYYAPARYPDIGEFVEFNEENAKEACLFAENIVSFVEKKLSIG